MANAILRSDRIVLFLPDMLPELLLRLHRLSSSETRPQSAPLLELKLRRFRGQTCCSFVALAPWPYSHHELDKSAACPHYCKLKPVSISACLSL